MSYKCPLCDHQEEKLISLSLHYRRIHHSTSKSLYILMFCEGIEPKCACGCGGDVKFHTLMKGFSKFIWGHAQRIHNNWGHNLDARKKSHDSRYKSYREGKWKTWNQDLTKETDERIAASGRKQSASYSDERRRMMSDLMSNSWKNGSLKPLKGAEHPGWKGGTSSLQGTCRRKLFDNWVRPHLASTGFKCSECGSSKNIEVHHDKERFIEILRKFVDPHHDENYTFEEKKLIAENVEKYHIENDVSGVVLCNKCHDKQHGKHRS